MAESSQLTAFYQEPPSVSLPERLPVALVAGSAGIDDLYRLLRRRLLVLASIVAGGQFTGVAISLRLHLIDPPPPGHFLHGLSPIEWAAVNWPTFLNMIIALIAAVVLWRRPPRTVQGLRVLEFVLIAPLAIVALTIGVHPFRWRYLLQAPGEPFDVRDAFISRYILSGCLMWTISITIYSTLIPNTARRCAAMASTLAISPLVLFAVYAFWLRPIAPEIAVRVLLVQGMYNGIAVAIGVFASSRVETLRRQAAEARKLGQYVLKEKLGAGGMGEVYRAEHVLLRRPCALKTIRPERAGDPEVLRRFEREVQVTATLTHPNTVQVFDYGHAVDGTFYYVMEYLPGLTLDELVGRHGPLPPNRAIHFLRQICAALGEAHSRGLTHRDIKPGNVMICERGLIPDFAKVLDFGLVRIPKDDPDGGTMTRDGAVAGTPAYMSPEQAGGHAIDPRSDIYSVGAVAYFLLTSKPPFAGRSAVKMMAAHLYEAPADLPADLPPELAAIVMRCLKKAPEHRWPNAAALSAALAAVAVPPWAAEIA